MNQAKTLLAVVSIGALTALPSFAGDFRSRCAKNFLSEKQIHSLSGHVRRLVFAKPNSKAADLKEASKIFVQALKAKLESESYRTNMVYRPAEDYLGCKTRQEWSLQILELPPTDPDFSRMNYLTKSSWELFIDPLYVDSQGCSIAVDKVILLSPRGWSHKIKQRRFVLSHEIRHLYMHERMLRGIESELMGEIDGKGEPISQQRAYRSYFAFEELYTYRQDVEALYSEWQKNPTLSNARLLSSNARALKEFARATQEALSKIVKNLHEDSNYFEDSRIVKAYRVEGTKRVHSIVLGLNLEKGLEGPTVNFYFAGPLPPRYERPRYDLMVMGRISALLARAKIEERRAQEILENLSAKRE